MPYVDVAVSINDTMDKSLHERGIYELCQKVYGQAEDTDSAAPSCPTRKSQMNLVNCLRRLKLRVLKTRSRRIREIRVGNCHKKKRERHTLKSRPILIRYKFCSKVVFIRIHN